MPQPTPIAPALRHAEDASTSDRPPAPPAAAWGDGQHAASVDRSPGRRLARGALLDGTLRYGAAVVFVALAVMLKRLVVPLVGEDAPTLLFFGSVMASARFGGFGPGATATVLAALASNFFFLQPYFRLDFTDPTHRWRAVLFIAEGLFISLLCDMLKRARLRAVASERTARTLERRILDVSEAEQRRIGHDLHDGLGQHLTGVAFMSRLLSRHLDARGVPEAEEAVKIEQLVNKAVTWTRTLAAGLSPIEIDAGDLPSALRQLALDTEEIFPTRCAVRCDEAPPPLAGPAATHLYRVAQEAISNAVKHGSPSHLWIELATRDAGRRVVLSVRDDGTGLSDRARDNGGMGLQTMAYRARMIGGTLDVRCGESGGTVVTCACPATADAARPPNAAGHA